MRRCILLVIACAALAWTVGTWASQERGQRNADPLAKERAALAREKYEDLFRKTIRSTSSASKPSRS